MRILIVAATEGETGPDLAHSSHSIDMLVTGVGMVATAVHCSRALASRSYDLALNLGVCGSFNPAFGPGSVVHVVADRFSELGAENRDAFLTIQDLRLAGPNDFPFTAGEIVNASPPVNQALGRLPGVHGITVNTVHGRAESIASVVERFAPDVESMEGAAFMFACLVAGVPFAQIRAVSNMVEPRNRAGWRMAEAVEALDHAARMVLDHV